MDEHMMADTGYTISSLSGEDPIPSRVVAAFQFLDYAARLRGAIGFSSPWGPEEGDSRPQLRPLSSIEENTYKAALHVINSYFLTAPCASEKE